MKEHQRERTVWKFILLGAMLLVGAFLLFMLVKLILAGYSVAWTGFADYKLPTSKVVRGKTLWDWMELLIIPLVLAGGALLLNRSERNTEREIATDRQQEAALQVYLDRMTELLLEKDLRTTENEEVRSIARMRTLTVLRGLDGKRKGIVVIFLYEAGLLFVKPVIALVGADLSGADLRGAFLKRVDLEEANLIGAHLSRANLWDANLIGADLSGANLSKANLREADMTEAKISPKQLGTAASFRAAVLPDGTKHN
jgi:hypothetical protein